jgi:hypothetical protein
VGIGWQVFARDGRLAQPSLIRQRKVATRVIVGHIALVAPEQVDMLPVRRWLEDALSRQSAKQGFRRLAPRKREVAYPAQFNRLCANLQQVVGGARPVQVQRGASTVDAPVQKHQAQTHLHIGVLFQELRVCAQLLLVAEHLPHALQRLPVLLRHRSDYTS